VVLIFHRDGVKMHQADSDVQFFRSEEKPWALVDSTEMSRDVCKAFRRASQMGRAWIVLATSPVTKRCDRLRKECHAGVFVMDNFTREESRALRSVFIAGILFYMAYSLSTVHGLDAERFMEKYNKWGPSARTCLGLAWGVITERELENEVVVIARKFAENPRPICIGICPEDGADWLFTSVPLSPERDVSALRVATPYLKGFIVEAIARTNAAKQVSFYTEARYHPFFRSAFGYIFEIFFLSLDLFQPGQ
jgi:hypothetical protein